MKIAFDFQAFTLQRYGGISRYFTTLAEVFHQQGEEVKVLAGLHQNQYLQRTSKEIVIGVGMEGFPAKSGSVFRIANHCFSQWNQSLLRPDIVHETYYSALPKLRSKVPRVLTVYDMIHERFPADFFRFDRTHHKKKKAINSADHIICISQSTKNDLLSYIDLDDSKVSVVHLGIDMEVFEPPSSSNAIQSEPFLLYVGNRSGYKNFSGFLEAYSNSALLRNNVKIKAFGGGEFNSSELNLFRKLGLRDGYVSQIAGDDVRLAAMYRSALCLVYPSKYEGFGIPPLEAMASGCPVVASNTSSLPEVIRDAGILFSPDKVDEIQIALETVVSDHNLRTNLIARGLSNVKQFGWSKVADNTMLVYKSLV